MQSYFPKPYDPNHTPFYNEIADLLAYLQSVINQHETNAKAYQDSSIFGKALLTIRNLFTNNKPYTYAKVLSDDLSLLQALQESTINKVTLDDNQIAAHFFTNDRQYNTNSLNHLSTTYRDAINNTRSVFNNTFSDRLKKHADTIDNFSQAYQQHKQTYKDNSLSLIDVFAWVRELLNMPGLKVQDLAPTISTNITEITNVKAAPQHTAISTMTRTVEIEEHEKARIKRVATPTVTTLTAVTETSIPPSTLNNDLSITERLDIVEPKVAQQDEQLNKIERQAAIITQQQADNTHDVKKLLQAEQQTEKKLHDVVKQQATAEQRLDKVRQNYGQMNQGLQEHKQKIKQGNLIVEETNKIKNEVDKSLERIDKSDKKTEAALQRYERRKLRQAIKDRGLAGTNMNDVNGQEIVLGLRKKI